MKELLKLLFVTGACLYVLAWIVIGVWAFYDYIIKRTKGRKILALPLVGKLLAKESESFAPPIEEVVECLECHSNMDCPPGTVCRTVNGVSRCEPLGKCDCECDPEPGRCVPPADGWIEFSVPMTRMSWEMNIHDYGAHTKKMRIFRNRWNGLQRGTEGEPGDARELLRRIKRQRG